MLSHFIRVQLFATPWTVAHQAPLSMGFSRQEYWNGLPCLPPGDLPNPGIKPASPALQADSLPLSQLGILSTVSVNTYNLSQYEARNRNLSHISFMLSEWTPALKFYITCLINAQYS